MKQQEDRPGNPAGASCRFVFGPVPSRRLGLSLGVDLVPLKTCTLDCVYCQLGRGRRRLRRGDYAPAGPVLAEIRSFNARGSRYDYLTFSGSGEPTLHRGLGKIVGRAKALTGKPVAVITNGTLLHREDVRRDLAGADVVLPSLDAASGRVFRAVNRPGRGIGTRAMTGGLELFRRGYRGHIWLEVMLVRGINDAPEELERLGRVIRRVCPDRIQLNTVTRPPAESAVQPLSPREMEAAAACLGVPCEVIAEFRDRGADAAVKPEQGSDRAVLDALARRPLTAVDVAASFGLDRERARALLERLVKTRLAARETVSGRIYYRRR